MSKNLKITGIILIAFALIFGFLIRLFVVLNFTQFSGDQINDAYRTMGIWEGSFPTLGPGPAAWSGIAEAKLYLPPLYYYLVFPFTALTPDLSSQAIFNAISTFLSIPLLSLLVYEMLSGVDNDKRIFLSGLAVFWYALLFKNIVFSTGDSLAGNPVSILFFQLVFVILYSFQINKKLSLIWQIICWIIFGIIVAVLVSLHFSTLFIMPVIFGGCIIFYISINPQSRKRWLLSGLSILSSLLALTPYWIGEINRSWLNNRAIISLVVNATSKEGHSVTFLQRINGIAHGYFNLGHEVYFIGTTWKSIIISLLFLLTVLVIGVVKFRGNKTIFFLLLSTWSVFLLSYSSTNMKETYNPVFYKALIYLAPIFLTTISLAYLKFSKIVNKILITFIIFCITISILINIKYHYNFVSSRAGMPRIPNTNDLAQVLTQIPQKSNICRGGRIHKYTDKYVTKREFEIIQDCHPGSYLIYSKYESLGNFKIHPTKPFSEAYTQLNPDISLFKETQLFDIYRFN